MWRSGNFGGGLLDEGAVKIDGEPHKDEDFTPSGTFVLQYGKRRFARILVSQAESVLQLAP